MRNSDKRMGYWVCGAYVLAWVVLAAGCGRLKEPAVVGKQEEEETGEGQTVQALEDGTENGEDILTMLSVPDRYETRLQEGGVILTADAAVEMPDIKGLGSYEIAGESFTWEEFERIGSSLADRLGLDWQQKEEQDMQALAGEEEGESQEESRHRVFRLEEGNMRWQIDYRWFPETDGEGNEEIGPSFIWWVNLDAGKWEGTPAGSETYGKSDPAMDGRLMLASEFEKDAEKLLREWGMEEYRIWGTWWVKSGYSDRPDEYRYHIRCTPVLEGIAFSRMKGVLEGVGKRESLPYVRFDYLEDGTLEVVNVVGKAKVSKREDGGMFFLPFQAVAELFEQYVRDCGKEMPDEGKGTRSIRVSRVKMEYAGVEGGRLVPVWTFYGADKGERRELPVLSVRADDGQVLGMEME